jgi:predicted N-acetyltransferase YhbS
MDIKIRNERPEDEGTVEILTREAFWNMHVPGCDEHYLVHVMRKHPDFIHELDFVLEVDGSLVGNIMYTRSWLKDKDGNEREIATFGPLSIHPAFQRRGLGKRLIEHSMEAARDMGYEAIVIFGNPGNYVSSGFVSCARHGISVGEGIFPTAMLVRELKEGALGPGGWTYRESEAYHLDPQRAREFDEGLERKEKAVLPRHEEFFILSNSRIIRIET